MAMLCKYYTKLHVSIIDQHVLTMVDYVSTLRMVLTIPSVEIAFVSFAFLLLFVWVHVRKWQDECPGEI